MVHCTGSLENISSTSYHMHVDCKLYFCFDQLTTIIIYYSVIVLEVVLYSIRHVLTSLNKSFFAGTSNHLNDNDEGYENITVARNLGLPDLELLRFVHEQITPGSVFYVNLTFYRMQTKVI